MNKRDFYKSKLALFLPVIGIVVVFVGMRIAGYYGSCYSSCAFLDYKGALESMSYYGVFIGSIAVVISTFFFWPNVIRTIKHGSLQRFSISCRLYRYWLL